MKSDHKISAVTAMPEGASTTASTTTPVYSEFELLHLNVSMLSQHNSMLTHQNLQLLGERARLEAIIQSQAMQLRAAQEELQRKSQIVSSQEELLKTVDDELILRGEKKKFLEEKLAQQTKLMEEQKRSYEESRRSYEEQKRGYEEQISKLKASAATERQSLQAEMKRQSDCFGGQIEKLSAENIALLSEKKELENQKQKLENYIKSLEQQISTLQIKVNETSARIEKTVVSNAVAIRQAYLNEQALKAELSKLLGEREQARAAYLELHNLHLVTVTDLMAIKKRLTATEARFAETQTKLSEMQLKLSEIQSIKLDVGRSREVSSSSALSSSCTIATRTIAGKTYSYPATFRPAVTQHPAPSSDPAKEMLNGEPEPGASHTASGATGESVIQDEASDYRPA